jgi:hypothetical protein
LTPNAAFMRSCAAWFAELSPEPPSESLAAFAFAALMKSWKLLCGLASRTTSASGV